MRLEVVWLLEVLAEDSVVVDLAVDGEGDCVILVGDGLRAGICSRELLIKVNHMTRSGHTYSDNAESFMDEDCNISYQ